MVADTSPVPVQDIFLLLILWFQDLMVQQMDVFLQAETISFIDILFKVVESKVITLFLFLSVPCTHSTILADPDTGTGIEFAE
jgi:hypothetical protein